MDGSWSILFKATMGLTAAILPSLIMLNVYFVSTIHKLELSQTEMKATIEAFTGAGPRYTPEMARTDNLELRQDILTVVASTFPPEWLKREVENLGERLDRLERDQKQGNQKH